MNLEFLNNKYAWLSPEKRIAELYNDFEEDEILFTSSFGITSVYLIHLFYRIKSDQPVHFIDTTYLFKETIEYKEQLTKLFNLKVIDILPEKWKNDFTRQNQTWASDPDFCCNINKVEPIEKAKKNFKVWVSGLMGFQNEFRSTLDFFEQSNDIIKFQPIIDVSQEEVKEYIKEYTLPRHQLRAKGYNSVGCAHCTLKGAGRSGRWADFAKTECGLHNNFIKVA